MTALNTIKIVLLIIFNMFSENSKTSKIKTTIILEAFPSMEAK
jgi:hypothetical protein